MKTVTEFPHQVTEYPDMPIEMSDGCRLSARVWMPKGVEKTPAPVILEHLPYRKRDGTIVRDQYTHPWFAGHGYICIRTDMRGNGDSDGLMFDEYTNQELQDAVEVIEWAAKQPWCNGNVGMMGISWGGFNGLQVAALAPKSLKAVITLCSTVDRYADDIHYKGGCLLGENFGWAANMLAYSSRPPDPNIVGARWKEMWLARLENLELMTSKWLYHQHRDDYWKHGSVCEDYSTIKAAVLSIGGWHDGYRNTVSNLVENLSAPVKGIVGPWIHKYPHYAGPAPAMGFLQEAKRWWDQWLMEENTGVENDPDYRVYLMDSIRPKRWLDVRPGRWIKEHKWPSKNIKFKKLFLGINGTLNNLETIFSVPISSPQDCGSAAGEYFPFAFSNELPDDQRCDDAVSVCFDSDLLSAPLDIVGATNVNLSLSLDKPQGMIVVRLCDLRPDGSSSLITYGCLNLTHRDSFEQPSSIPLNSVLEIELKLDQAAYHIPINHKLRIAISTSYWPTLWPSQEQTEIKLSAGRIELPVRPLADGDEIIFEAAEGAPAWAASELRAANYERTSYSDPETGLSHIKIFCDNGENEDSDHGLISGSWMEENWSIHPEDSTSASVSSNWEHTGGRAGEMWRTHVISKMTSDKINFFVTAVVTAYENEKLIFRREYKNEILRNLV